MASLGVDAYRFSMAWSRVQPLGNGAWNEAGFDFYDRLLDALDARGIAAHLTLYHWDLPQGLQDEGGWLDRATPRTASPTTPREVARRFGDRLASIATHNEPWCTRQPRLRQRPVRARRGRRRSGDPGLAPPAAVARPGDAGHARRGGIERPQLGIVLNQWTADPATD